LLNFVPTPIGNLADITIRSLEILAQSEIVFCEDTRVSKQLFKLLQERFSFFFQKQIEREFISLHQHNEDYVLEKLNIEIFKSNVVYLSDAGTPGISDPGTKLIQFAITHQIDFEILPGATASIIAPLLSGFLDKQFLFWGFLPHKGKERRKQLEQILAIDFTTTIYEAPHRILKLIKEIVALEPHRDIFLVKELTKKFETRFRGTAEEVLKKLEKSNLKGEWVVVVKASDKNNFGVIQQDDIFNLSISSKEKAKLLSKITGENTKAIYQKIIQEKNN
jgi:16S rRNA (cytidine1402-2'-O)-methyltransferase